MVRDESYTAIVRKERKEKIMGDVVSTRTEEPFTGKAGEPTACQDCKKCVYKIALVKLLALAMTTLQELPEGRTLEEKP